MLLDYANKNLNLFRGESCKILISIYDVIFNDIHRMIVIDEYFQSKMMEVAANCSPYVERYLSSTNVSIL